MNVSNVTIQVDDIVLEFFNNTSSLGKEVSQLWLDALQFLNDAERMKSPEKRERLLRASILTAAAAFEAWTNFLADRIAQAGEVAGGRLGEFEIDCLREKHKVLQKGKVKDERKLYSAKDRFLLLFRLLSGDKEFPDEMLSRLEKSFEVRDEVVHPKPGISINLGENRRGHDAVYGFLQADLILSKVWGGRKFTATPRGTFASLGSG